MTQKIQAKKKIKMCGFAYGALTLVCIIAVIFTAVACYDKPINLETNYLMESVWLYLSLVGFFAFYTLTAKSIFEVKEWDIQCFLNIVNFIAVAVLPFLKLRPEFDAIREALLSAIIAYLAFRQIIVK